MELQIHIILLYTLILFPCTSSVIHDIFPPRVVPQKVSAALEFPWPSCLTSFNSCALNHTSIGMWIYVRCSCLSSCEERIFNDAVGSLHPLLKTADRNCTHTHSWSLATKSNQIGVWSQGHDEHRKTLESDQFECNTADTSTSHTKNEHIANIEGAKVHHNLSHCKRVSWLKVLFDVHPQMQKHPKHQPVGSENREGRLIYKNTICGYPYKFHREYPIQSQAIRQSKYIKSSLHIHSIKYIQIRMSSNYTCNCPGHFSSRRCETTMTSTDSNRSGEHFFGWRDGNGAAARHHLSQCILGRSDGNKKSYNLP